MDSRFKKLRQLLKTQSLDAVLISSVPNIYYLTDYAGFSRYERDGYVFITKDSEYIITNALFIDGVKEQIKHLQVIEYTRHNPLKNILDELVIKHKIESIGFENENITVAEYTRFQDVPVQFIPVDLETLRMLKSKVELQTIQKACAIGDKAFTYICTQLQEDMTEKQLASKLEQFIKIHNADLSFRTVVAFGKNAAVPHHLSGNDTLSKNTCVLIDFGVLYKNYCSDMTRTIFFGKPTHAQEKVYQTVREAQKKAVDYIEDCLQNNQFPIPTTIDQTARDYVVNHGYPPFNHSSHGIGLEVHEYPHVSSNTTLMQNGMVFSIEPGIYLPGEMGVRIEDIFVIQNKRLTQLTKSTQELITL